MPAVQQEIMSNASRWCGSLNRAVFLQFGYHDRQYLQSPGPGFLQSHLPVIVDRAISFVERLAPRRLFLARHSWNLSEMNTWVRQASLDYHCVPQPAVGSCFKALYRKYREPTKRKVLVIEGRGYPKREKRLHIKIAGMW